MVFFSPLFTTATMTPMPTAMTRPIKVHVVPIEARISHFPQREGHARKEDEIADEINAHPLHVLAPFSRQSQ